MRLGEKETLSCSWVLDTHFKQFSSEVSAVSEQSQYLRKTNPVTNIFTSNILIFNIVLASSSVLVRVVSKLTGLASFTGVHLYSFSSNIFLFSFGTFCWIFQNFILWPSFCVCNLLKNFFFNYYFCIFFPIIIWPPLKQNNNQLTSHD